MRGAGIVKFKVLEKNGEERVIDFIPKHIINAGYTGRDQALSLIHIFCGLNYTEHLKKLEIVDDFDSM